MFLVLSTEEDETHERHQQEERVTKLATLFPGGDFGRIGLSVVVITTSVEPVTVTIDVEFLEVTEFVHGVVLQVVGDDLVIIGGLGLICESIEGGDTSGLVGNLHLGVEVSSSEGLGSRLHQTAQHHF